MASPVWAQFPQQVGPLVGSPTTAIACQGVNVALSSDGRTALVGSPGDNGGTGTSGAECDGGAGAAFVYIHTNSGWVQQAKLLGTGAIGAANQGYSVAVSADGNTAAIGGPTDNSSVGAVWFFTRSAGVWTQQQKVVGSGNTGASLQGRSVSLSSDGNTVVVGGPGDDRVPVSSPLGVGAVWIFARSGGVWSQVGGKLVGTGAVGQSFQGSGASISADGNTVMAGGPFDNTNVGAAWVFTQTSPGVWGQQGAKIVPSGLIVPPPLFGSSTSLSANGNDALVGAFGDSGGAGATWVYTRSGVTWSAQQKLTANDSVGLALQGGAVSISADGNMSVVGGNRDNGENGAVWVYTRSGTVWTQSGTKLVGTGASTTARQGTSVALAPDKLTLIEGGYFNNSVVGAAWIFGTSTGASLATTTSVTSSLNPSTAGQGVTFTATVTNSGGVPGTPTGFVTFFDGAVLLGTGPPLNASGQTSLFVFGLSAGSHSITAVYGGDVTFSGSTSSILTQVVKTAQTITVTTHAPASAPFGSSFPVVATASSSLPVTIAGSGSCSGSGSSGSATITITSPTGTCTVTFSQAGDATFGAAPVVTETTTATQAATSLTTPSATGTLMVGQTITISTTLAVTAPGAGTPTGTISFFLNGATLIGAANVTSGAGTYSINYTLASTTGTITAVYSGDTNFAGSTSPGLDLSNVGKANTSTALTSSLNPSTLGQAVTFTATVTSGVAGTIAGTVNFLDGVTTIGSGALNGSGVATFITSALTAGTHSITAVYSSDATFAASTSAVLAQVVKADQTITITTHAPASAPFGSTFTVSATSSSGLAVSIAGSGGCSGSGSGSAIITMTSSTLACTVTYSQAGNVSFNAAPPLTDTTTAAKAATSLSTPIGAGTLVVGQTITLSTTLAITAPGGGTPTGTITFTNGATTIGTATVSGAGTYTINYTLVSTTGSIVATYSGDGNFQGATSSAFNLANVKVPTTTSLSGPVVAQSNQSLTYTATVTVPAGSGVTPGGTVAFTLNSSPVVACQTLALNGGGATCNIIFSSSGTQTVSATYSGDSNTAGSTASLQVSTGGAAEAPPSFVLTVSSSAPGPTVGQPVTFTVTLTGPGTPQGSVQIFDGSTLLGTGVVRNGQTTITVPSFSAGSHNLLAVFNNTNGPNVATVFGQYVYALPTSLALAVSPSPSVFGQTVTLTAQISFGTPPQGIAAPTGTVRFFDGATLLGSVTVAAGAAVFQISQLAAGVHQLTAIYSGDSSWNASVSNAVSHTVNPAATTTTASALPDYSGAALQITLTAKVTAVAPGAGVPAGTVQFVDVATGSVLATATLDAGAATVKFGDRPTPGARNIRAIFSGNANYLGSMDTVPLLLLVNAADFSSTAVAGNEIATIFGSSLADSTGPATALPLPEKLGGSAVTVRDSAGVDHPAQLFYASPTQINLLIPPNLGTGNVTVTVTNSAGRTFALITRVAAVAPGLFSAEATGRGVAAAQIVRVAPDGTQTISNAASMGSGGAILPVPIDLSDANSKFYVMLYATGLRAGRNVTATINGISVPVLYSGAQPSFAGLDQVNLGPLPVSLRGASSVDVQIMVDGQPSNTVTLMFQ